MGAAAQIDAVGPGVWVGGQGDLDAVRAGARGHQDPGEDVDGIDGAGAETFPDILRQPRCEVRLPSARPSVQGADAADAWAVGREQGQDGGGEEDGARRRLRSRRLLDHEDLPLVRHAPQLGAGGVDQAVVGDEPLLVERGGQDTHRLGAGARLAGQAAGAAGLARQLGHRRGQGAGAGGGEQGLAVRALRLQQGVPAGLQGGRVGGRGPPRPSRGGATDHGMRSASSGASSGVTSGIVRPRQWASRVTVNEKRSPR